MPIQKDASFLWVSIKWFIQFNHFQSVLSSVVYIKTIDRLLSFIIDNAHSNIKCSVPDMKYARNFCVYLCLPSFIKLVYASSIFYALNFLFYVFFENERFSSNPIICKQCFVRCNSWNTIIATNVVIRLCLVYRFRERIKTVNRWASFCVCAFMFMKSWNVDLFIFWEKQISHSMCGYVFFFRMRFHYYWHDYNLIRLYYHSSTACIVCKFNLCRGREKFFHRFFLANFLLDASIRPEIQLIYF